MWLRNIDVALSTHSFSLHIIHKDTVIFIDFRRENDLEVSLRVNFLLFSLMIEDKIIYMGLNLLRGSEEKFAKLVQ